MNRGDKCENYRTPLAGCLCIAKQSPTDRKSGVEEWRGRWQYILLQMLTAYVFILHLSRTTERQTVVETICMTIYIYSRSWNTRFVLVRMILRRKHGEFHKVNTYIVYTLLQSKRPNVTL